MLSLAGVTDFACDFGVEALYVRLVIHCHSSQAVDASAANIVLTGHLISSGAEASAVAAASTHEKVCAKQEEQEQTVCQGQY